jgi:hypothetical protein
LKHILNQYAKHLKNNLSEKKLFVQNGGLEKLQELKSKVSEALKEKIHEIHNYLRNNGAGYDMSALKVFNITPSIIGASNSYIVFQGLQLTNYNKFLNTGIIETSEIICINGIELRNKPEITTSTLAPGTTGATLPLKIYGQTASRGVSISTLGNTGVISLDTNNKFSVTLSNHEQLTINNTDLTIGSNNGVSGNVANLMYFKKMTRIFVILSFIVLAHFNCKIQIIKGTSFIKHFLLLDIDMGSVILKLR